MNIRSFAIVALGLLVSPAAQAETQLQRFEASQAAVAQGKDPIPGPKTCFWNRGPHSGDPYINIAYPDAGTFYWAAVFTTPAGARLTLEGRFPHARYMSVAGYDGKGRPVESVADYLIKPVAGSTNPFLPGSNRTAIKRDYTLDIVDGQPDPKNRTGMNLTGETRSRVAAPKYGFGQQVVLYRVYARDLGTDETGNGGLPEAVLTLADGRVLRGTEACAALNTRQPPQLDTAAMAVPMDKYRELLDAAAKLGPTYPAENPPTWYIQLDREALYDIYRGKAPSPDAPRSEGGFYPNLDNQYIRTILNRRLGKVFVLRGKAPTTPHTIHGDPVMGSGELRYWSFCSNQGFANTRVNACVHDENVPVAPKGYYTLVVSRAADRPRNAIKECGVTWLPMADDGDGALDPDMTVLQMRNMLGTRDFAHSVQAIPKPGQEAVTMAEYFPKGTYMTTSAFEAGVPCLIEKRP